MSVQKCININLCAVQKTGKGHREARTEGRRRSSTCMHSGYGSRVGIGKFVKWRSHVRLLYAPALAGYICYFIRMVVEAAFELVAFMKFELICLLALPFLKKWAKPTPTNTHDSIAWKATIIWNEHMNFLLFPDALLNTFSVCLSLLLAVAQPMQKWSGRAQHTAEHDFCYNHCYPLLFLF